MKIDPSKTAVRSALGIIACAVPLTVMVTGSSYAAPMAEMAPAISPAPAAAVATTLGDGSLETARYNGVGQANDTCGDHYEYYGTAPAHREFNGRVYGGIRLYTSATELQKSSKRKFCFQGLATTLVDYNGMKFDIELVNNKGKVLKKDTVRMDETESPAVFDGNPIVTANKGDFLRLTTHNPGSNAVAIQPLG